MSETLAPRVKFRWWAKCRTPEGNIVKMEGHIFAETSDIAADEMDKKLRAEFPGSVWMQGKRLEGEGVQYLPTVQQCGKQRRAA